VRLFGAFDLDSLTSFTYVYHGRCISIQYFKSNTVTPDNLASDQLMRYNLNATYLTIKNIRSGILVNGSRVDNAYPPANVSDEDALLSALQVALNVLLPTCASSSST
jgi:hypothetical protein